MVQKTIRRSLAHAKALVLGLLLAVLVSLMLAASPAHAGQTFTVNNTGDPLPGDPDFGVCNVNFCTLRTAIVAANNHPGPDTIEFNIPRPDLRSVTPVDELPAITEAVTIDGYSQIFSRPNSLPVGSDANLLVHLSGRQAGSAGGLTIEADGVTVRGLIIDGFEGAGINIEGSDNKIEGNFIGTDRFGRGAPSGNGDDGVDASVGERNIVGGNTPAARNVISGNGGNGVGMFGTNLGPAGNKVQNNYIGTDKSGTGDLGNTFAGVSISDSAGNVVGGGEAEANLIAFNKGDGVAVRSLSNNLSEINNPILSNSIFSNGDLGIDLGTSGPTANDPQDPDTGPNDLQNKPVLTSATISSGGTTTVRGSLDSAPNKPFLIEFFSNASGEDEGKKFIGQQSVATDEGGDVSFTFTTSQVVAAGQTVTATATTEGRARNTSEFSDAVAVEDGSLPPENVSPVATDDAFKAKKGKTLNVPAPGLLKNDSDPDGDPLTAQFVTDPAKGTLKLNADGSFSYKPKRGFERGTDSFTYRVSDGKGGTDTAKVTIKIVKKKK